METLTAEKQTLGVSTRLQGRWLWIARLGWLAFFAAAVGVLLAAVPARWAELTHLGPITLANLQVLSWPVAFYASYSLTTELIFIATFMLVGLLIFIRRSDDRMALFTALMLVAFGIGNQTITSTVGALRPYALGRLIFACGGFAAWVTFTQFPFLFPSGRYAPAWARIPALVWFLLCIPWNFMVGTRLDPTTWPPALFLPLFLAMWAAFPISQIQRYRRVSNPVERQQTKWVVYALAMVAAGELILFVAGYLTDIQYYSYLLAGEPPTPRALAIVLSFQGASRLYFLLLPLAFALSILRRRLWDIDILIRRTLVYSAFTGLLAMIYFGSVVILQSVFRSFTGATSQFALVLSTLAIAALFFPLRSQVQAFIDRRFYRQKYDAQKVLAEFAAHARDETDLEKLTEHLDETVRQTMQPESVSVWLVRPGREKQG